MLLPPEGDDNDEGDDGEEVADSGGEEGEAVVGGAEALGGDGAPPR
jgi:hypothetical protein